MKRLFLETNSYSNYFRNDKRVIKVVSRASEVLISVITLGELCLGFTEGGREEKNLKLLSAFLNDFRVKIVDVNIRIAWHYGKIKYVLRRKGTPIPDNDIWIAAQVAESGATLVTYDKHFLEIPGLKIWSSLS